MLSWLRISCILITCKASYSVRANAVDPAVHLLAKRETSHVTRLRSSLLAIVLNLFIGPVFESIILAAAASMILSNFTHSYDEKIYRALVARAGLGTPLIFGPATMAASVTLADIHGQFLVLVGLLINLAVLGLLLYYQDVVTKWVHLGISRAFGKVMSLLLAAIAVAMIRTGVTNLIHLI